MKSSIRNYRCGLILLSVFLLTQIGHAEQPITLAVQVVGGQPNKGKVILSIFSSSENYLKSPINKKSLPINDEGNALFQFDYLEPGTYAISVVYDKDENGKLNTGFLGIPTELVGFSNNARGRFGPPSFKDTSFALVENRTIEIYLGKVKN